MKILDCQQGSIQWMQAHLGMPTAGGMHALLSPEFKVRDGEMPRTYCYTKLAEEHRGRPLIELSTFSIEQGTIVEEKARPFYALETNQTVRQVGFIETDDGRCGASPDGLVGEGDDMFGLEIKAPSAPVHMKFLVEGVLPKDYIVQVQVGLYVTGFKKWEFMSYREDFPPFILEVFPDATAFERIGEALDKFYKLMEEGRKRLLSASVDLEARWSVAPK